MNIKVSSAMLLLGFALAGCAAVPSAIPAAVPEPVKASAAERQKLHIAMATDLHYQPQVSDAASSLIPQMKYISQLVDCLLDETSASQPDVLLLCGDLTNNGHKSEHQALIEKLEDAQTDGMQILVIPGNHDLKDITKEEFAKLYENYGYQPSLMRDTASLSYVYPLSDRFWLLMLDTNADSRHGGIREETLTWIGHVLTEAKEAGADVISASHYNLLGHSSSQYNKQSVFEGQDTLLNLLKTGGVRLNISGHLHKQHAVKDSSGKGSFYEVTGGMLSDYPNPYSSFTVDSAARTIVFQSHTLDVESWAADHGQEEDELLYFSEYSRACRRMTADGLVGGMLSAMDISGDNLRTLTKFWTNIYMDASDGSIHTTRADYLSSDDYRLWQQFQNRSKYSEWLDFLLEQKGAVDSHSLLIKY